MNKPSNRKDRDVTAALYVRLSREDGMDSESNSVQNQKKLLTKTAKEKGYSNLLLFSDDGISGVTMDRPGYNEMISELSNGHISALFVKDLSRLGRNYIEVGKLTEDFLPEYDIRLVAVSDGVDTDEGENDLNPIRNLFNEWYARDISKKGRVSNKVRGNAGEPLGQPPYGYCKDSDNPKKWVIDPEAAEVVRRIYDMTIDGKGVEQIAGILTSEKILTPSFYWQSKGINRPKKGKLQAPHHWYGSTVASILAKREYVGDLVNFKTYSKSYKSKKRLQNDPENMAIFTDVNEPIVERALWERIQEKRGKTRKRKAKDGEKNMFSGLLICADCGRNLWCHFNHRNPDIKYFNCSGYNTRHGTCPTTHYVRVDFLEEVVLQEIRRLTKYASKYEDEFAEAVMGFSQQNDVALREKKQKELNALQNRDRELDRIFNRMYEDHINALIDDDRFRRMSAQYTAEQRELAEKIKTISTELEQQQSKASTKDTFISTVRKYTRIKKLSERILNELIERIEVHQSEKVDGVQVQKLAIYYNCVGVVEIPEMVELPEISMQVKNGATYSYEPTCQSA